ncbi:MAG TPA: PVC-type heme-binding CxxCH protein [Pirellulales bacterium]|nr:PVC-type heme-binding CxxCH protein [Pirellulales bacterium]
MNRILTFLTAILTIAISSHSFAQSVEPPDADNSVAAEQKSFKVSDGFEVNLFADETNGVANPIAIRWDHRGRLWVLCTWAYPQLKPNEAANDKLLILEDTDGDGRADKTTVFADGMNMPTGFALGDGGAYIAHATELLHLKDTDGNDQADQRAVLFTGFGTGDTHQNINSLTWSPGGELLFCQGLHTFSRVETPWGIERLDEHGVWRLRPRRRQLHAYHGGSGQNPWGIAFGYWGEPFIKGNGPEISELLPNLVHTGTWQNPVDIGKTKIKSMILEFVETPHLPDDLQGEVLIAGYFGHVIDRIKIVPDGAGHRAIDQGALLHSTHSSFRPVDIQIGPDGGIYVADWFNPIIGHYQASFRHPDRDTTHGRIWRISAKGRRLDKPPALDNMSPAELCDQLTIGNRWVRLQAKWLLMQLPSDEATAAVTTWLKGLDPDDPQLEHHLYEALGVFESHEVVNESLLKRLLGANDHRARAYATRVVGRWHDRLDSPLALLRRSVADPHPRVQLEAVVSCSAVPSAEAMVVAATLSSQSPDRFVDHALKQCVQALAPYWLPALQNDKIEFAETSHLVSVLRTYGRDVAEHIRGMLERDSLSDPVRNQLLDLLAQLGDENDVRVVFDYAVDNMDLFVRFGRTVESRRIRASGETGAKLRPLLSHPRKDVRATAVRLAGLWQQASLTSDIKERLNAKDSDVHIRAAAIRSLAELAPADAVEQFRPFIAKDQVPEVWLAALQAVSHRDLQAAITDGLTLLAETQDDQMVAPVLETVMQRRGAADAMAVAIKSVKLSADDAKLIARWMNAAGRDHPDVTNGLKVAMGFDPGDAPAYEEAYVKQLADEIRESGSPTAGHKVFQSSITNCTACHRVEADTKETETFARGPQLTAVAAGLPLELIIEAVVWPKRQVKEGYELTTLYLDDGRVLSGYITARAARTVTIRDLATGDAKVVARDSIEDFSKQGTAMPSGFTNTLTRSELRDLVAYLATLKG